MNLDIGNRLRKLRKKRGMSIKNLSDKSEVSTGQISQIEQGKVMPSVICLWKLAEALDTNINYFFEEERATCRVQHSGERVKIILNGGHSEYEMLTPADGKRNLDMVRITLESDQEYDPGEGITHPGEECGYVLEGNMTVHIDGEDFKLVKGDSIYFRSTLPHYFVNTGSETCISLWAVTPVLI